MRPRKRECRLLLSQSENLLNRQLELISAIPDRQRQQGFISKCDHNLEVRDYTHTFCGTLSEFFYLHNRPISLHRRSRICLNLRWGRAHSTASPTCHIKMLSRQHDYWTWMSARAAARELNVHSSTISCIQKGFSENMALHPTDHTSAEQSRTSTSRIV